jgi:putative ABC transport system permease protein
MNYREVSKVAWKSLLSNKLRSLLTMLGVIIGVAAVIIMIAVSAGTEATISEAINGLGSNLIFISTAFTRGGPSMGPSSSSGGLKYDDATAISEKISGIAGVSVEQSASETIKFDGTTLSDVTVVGTTIDYPTVREVEVATGRYFTQDEMDNTRKVVVLGSSIADELFSDSGTDPIGQYITVGNTKLTVIGVLAPKGLSSGTDYDEQIYTPISVVFKKFTPSQFARIMGDDVRMIIVSVKDKDQMEAVVQQITLLLVNRHEVTVDTADFSITTQDDIIETQESTTSSFRTLLGWVAGVSLIVGGIGIMNIMLVSVTERTREIGLRQAVGATPGDIQTQFLLEALMLSLLGGVIGVIAGVVGAWLFGSLSGMRTVISSFSIILSFCSAALIGIFFGYLPAHKAAQLDPIVALRHE